MKRRQLYIIHVSYLSDIPMAVKSQEKSKKRMKVEKRAGTGRYIIINRLILTGAITLGWVRVNCLLVSGSHIYFPSDPL